MSDETVNARITKTMLGIEDHGMMTFVVFLEWSGASHGLGTYSIDKYGGSHEADRPGHAPAITAIRKILETVGVREWEELPGQLLRLKLRGYSEQPIIGHIMDDRWFDLREFMKANSP